LRSYLRRSRCGDPIYLYEMTHWGTAFPIGVRGRLLLSTDSILRALSSPDAGTGELLSDPGRTMYECVARVDIGSIG
jgi:hypothetical protein